MNSFKRYLDHCDFQNKVAKEVYIHTHVSQRSRPVGRSRGGYNMYPSPLLLGRALTNTFTAIHTHIKKPHKKHQVVSGGSTHSLAYLAVIHGIIC